MECIHIQPHMFESQITLDVRVKYGLHCTYILHNDDFELVHC